jgi:predicted 3-demethylubiquinone-9 3-methyltransferase (glyoxalase superfamily)
MTQSPTLRTFLWYSSGLQEALNFYKRAFGEGMQVAPEHLTNEQLFTAEFSIYGHQLIGMSMPGGEMFNNSISLSIQVDGQIETDRLWEALTSNGAPGRCGWCTDEWGVNWQVTPYQMGDFLGHSEPKIAEQNWALLRGMTKIELAQFIQ